MKAAAITIAMLAVLAFAIFEVHHIWSGVQGVTISTAGLIALGLGILFTFALGAGLMFLIFYSNRRGYDDTHMPPPPPPDERSDR